MKRSNTRDILAAMLCIAVYILLLFVCELAGYISPVLWVGAPVVSAFLGAFPMAYLMTRTGKPFIALGTALLWTLLIFASGESGDPAAVIFPAVSGIAAEAVRKAAGYGTPKGTRLSCSLLSLIAFAPIITLWTDTETYLSAAAEEMGGEEYSEVLRSCSGGGALALIIVLTLAAGYAGAFAAEKIGTKKRTR
ncbi:MAG: MptD family putative ECF transporter S component [Ruminococcus sp.]|nr:MptD family putative ECF transporter S component [Ruminococcus sp.]